MNLLSQVTATLSTLEVCPSKTVSCLLSEILHILIVLSLEPEIINLLSVVNARAQTESVCPSKTAS